MFYNFRNFVSMFDIFVYVQFIREVDGVVIQLIKMMLMFFFCFVFCWVLGIGWRVDQIQFLFLRSLFLGGKRKLFESYKNVKLYL